MSQPEYSRDEIMTVTAARQLRNGAVCFVGIGLPSAACNLARLTHAPDLVLIYESGTVGVQPAVLPLSIGDGELADTATCIVPLPEIFAHYLQRGRIDVGFLGAAQIDRFGNLNSTVIGAYAHPQVRPRGAGGDEADGAQLRPAARLPHLLRLPRGPRRTPRASLAGRGTESGDHRFRRAAPERRDRGAGARCALSGRQRRGRARRYRLAVAGRQVSRSHRAARAARARGVARPACAHRGGACTSGTYPAAV